MTINHKKNVINAFRTALVAIAGFIIYELLLEIEKLWNELTPSKYHYNLHKRRLLHFLGIFLIDLILIYTIFYIFNVEV
jgi:hypothetical protein